MAKLPGDWRKRESVVGRTYKRDEFGMEVVASEELGIDYVCSCGQRHAFLPATSEEQIVKFLAQHKHGDFRLTPDHPAKERLLTEAQWKDHLDAPAAGQMGPNEAKFYAERGGKP